MQYYSRPLFVCARAWLFLSSVVFGVDSCSDTLERVCRPLCANASAVQFSDLCDGHLGVPQSEMSDLYATRRLLALLLAIGDLAPPTIVARKASGLIWLRVNGHSFNAITAHKLYLDWSVVLDYTFWQGM